MAPRASRVPDRAQRRTVLVVGEGLAEQVFLGHLRALYVARGSKSVTVKNAKGKGGAHVLDYTLRQARQAAYDELAALLDTDTQWGERERTQARQKKVRVFEATPCLEALLLQIVHPAAPVGDATALKRQFEQRLGTAAHDARVYERHFSRAVLDAAGQRLPVLAALIDFLRG